MSALGKPEAYRTVRRQSRNFSPSLQSQIKKAHESQDNNLRYLTARCFSAFCLLLTAFCVNARAADASPKRNTIAASSTFTIGAAVSFAISHAARKSASMGCGDFVSRVAV